MTIEEISQASEKVSVKYTQKFGLLRDSHWFLLRLQDEIGELTHVYLKLTGAALKKNKTEAELKQNLSEEVADVICHALLLAHHAGVNVEKSIHEKWFSYLEE